MRKPVILVVDDERSNRLLLRGILEPRGYEVIEAQNGAKALAAVASTVPDLILLDALMPNLDGYDVCSKLKGDEKTKLIPVVMLTSLAELPDKLKAVDMGVDGFMTKPYQIPELLSRVKSLLSLKRYTDELEPVSRVLEGVALVVESRDRYTGDHCKRLGEYAARMGAELQLDADDIRVLRLGGSLHDLGKVAIPDAILNKPGRLTAEEFALMRTHSAVGADLCRGMRTIEKVIPLIRHHHERLDGSGYPAGLKGDEISLLVRIISIADVYDALATRRSYKEALPPEKCLAILREEAQQGWWDGEIVEALARTLGSKVEQTG